MSVVKYCYIVTLHDSAIIIYPTHYECLSQVMDMVNIFYEHQVVVFITIPYNISYLLKT